MKFVIVDPWAVTVETIDVADLNAAKSRIGLDKVGVDFGTIIMPYKGRSGVAVVCYEYGLLDLPKRQRFFALGNQLFAGKAVLFGFDEDGMTVNLTWQPAVRFFGSVPAIEAAINAGDIVRPTVLINDRVVWAWPAKSPD